MPAGYGYGEYPAAAVPQGMYFDQLSGLTLPEGTQLASVGRRIGAYFLAIPLAIVTLGIGYIVWGLIVWGNGQTPAQQVLGMRCWRPETSRVPGFWYMALREIVGGIVTGILGFITEITSFVLFLTGREHKAIHDYIAGTVVLLRPEQGPRQLTSLRRVAARVSATVGGAAAENAGGGRPATLTAVWSPSILVIGLRRPRRHRIALSLRRGPAPLRATSLPSSRDGCPARRMRVSPSSTATVCWLAP